MAVDLTQAKLHLNVTNDDDDDELAFFVAAANEWIATQVDDVTPTPVQLATLELVRHWWSMSQLGPMDVPEPDDVVGFLGMRVPPFVHEMLGPYLPGAGGTAPPAAVGSFPDAADWPDPVGC